MGVCTISLRPTLLAVSGRRGGGRGRGREVEKGGRGREGEKGGRGRGSERE